VEAAVAVAVVVVALMMVVASVMVVVAAAAVVVVVATVSMHRVLKELHFADVTEIQEGVTVELKKVQKEEFSAAFQKLYDCTKICIYASGAYFE